MHRLVLARFRRLQSTNLWQNRRLRIGSTILVAGIVLAQLANVLSPFLVQQTYALGGAESLLAEKEPLMAEKLTYNSQEQKFSFDSKQSIEGGVAKNAGGGVAAIAYTDASRGISVTDSTNKVDFKLIPKFRTVEGQKDGNRIIYPLSDGTGWLVYTMQGVGTKEDIVLNRANSNDTSYSYTLELGDSLQARLQKDGSIGVFGNTLLSGNVSTGTDKDAELLKKARQGAAKDSLLFAIPKPVVLDAHGPANGIDSKYELNGNELTLKVSGLDKGNYPITIDPSIYVVTAQQFMAGNNETNINFDVDNKLIKKGRTTGARFDQWNTASNLPRKVWGAQTVASGGFIYSVGGTSFDGQVYTSQGSSTYTVPSGVTSIDVKVWGAGGGGGGGGINAGGVGGAGGGGGFVQTSIAVTPGEVLNIYVGGGGVGGSRNGMGYGGGGGGYSSIYRASAPSTPLVIAAGGGGGGGGRGLSSNTGGPGGAGGGTTGVNGSDGGGTAGAATGGFGGTQSAGGATGTSGTTPGTAGSSLAGGRGGNGSTLTDGSGGNGGAANGGLATGGPGGLVSGGLTRAAGGGGGSGYFGGGGGVGGTGSTGGSGGGGGSSYDSSGTGTLTAGSGTSPGGSSDVDRLGAGDGGAGGATLNSGTTGDNGLVSIANGVGATAASSQVNWAKLNTSTGTIDNANPGTGACTTWCSTAAYNLPGGRSNYSLVAYNGYLYAIGGTNSACTVGNGTGTTGYCKTVYVAKLGANGEPRLWHPTDSNTSNWSYWYRDADLPAERAFTAAVAYNNKMYLLGGRTSSSATTAVTIANITPNGKLGTWNASAATLPSANQYDLSAQVYNDRLYILGGSSSTTAAPTNTVYYNKINTDGSLNSWIQTSSFSSGRISNGGKISVVWGGYMYISGGCTAVNASGYCTTVASDTQVASINADGSLTTWSTVANVSSTRTGHNLVAWRDNIYAIGGCSSVDTNGGGCSLNMLDSIQYGSINQDGDVSTVADSAANGVGTCSGSTPTNCNTTAGNMLATVLINNGYLYVIGGCTNVGCTTTSSSVAFTGISAAGDLVRPASCPGGAPASNGWCVQANVLSTGRAGMSANVFYGYVWFVGGFTGSALSDVYQSFQFNADGTLTSAAQTQTLTSAGATAVSYAYTYTRGLPAATGSTPAYIYIFGGCTTSGSGPSCSNFTQNVYRCTIATNSVISGCTTTGQLQLGTVTGASGAGLALASGAVFANYIYLIGGSAPGLSETNKVRYAKFDSSQNIVTAGSGWVESSQVLPTATSYTSAFAYNGYLYAIGGYNSSSGIQNTIRFIKINTSDGSLDSGGWKTSTITITGRWGLTTNASNGYAYMIGGCSAGNAPSSCSALSSSVQKVKIYNNDSGSPAGWSTSNVTNFTQRYYQGTVVYNGYLYVAGGCNAFGFFDDCGSAINTVQYAAIGTDGALGNWSTTSAALPVAAGSGAGAGKLVVAGGTLYYVGGNANSYSAVSSAVYYGTPAGSGDVTSWGTATNGLPQSRTWAGVTVWNNRIYVAGGFSPSCTSNACGTVYISPQLNSGGNITSAWTTATNTFDTSRYQTTIVAYANNLYILGGINPAGSLHLSDVQYAPINTSTGDLGTWNFTTSLPDGYSGSNAIAVNGYLYLFGGAKNGNLSTCGSSTLIAPISGNTSIASGNQPTGIGNWFETNVLMNGGRYGNANAYYDGKVYTSGGICSNTWASGPNVQQTTLQTQPQVAKYSISFDTDTNVYPQSYLFNGIDNSIGAQWQLRYRSMSDPGAVTSLGTGVDCSASQMSDWGQTTTVSSLALGSLGTYIPLDGSGANMSCGRYYNLNASIDAQNAFGFPDDVSRGPTITDTSLRYTAAPQKRLMHGRTFINGTQNPLDSPKYNN